MGKAHYLGGMECRGRRGGGRQGAAEEGRAAGRPCGEAA